MIDWTRVRDLKDEVGEEEFREVVELFLDEVEETIAGLPGIVDATAMMQALHFLKGSALSLGFAGFCDRCTESERQCAEGSVDRVDLDALMDSYARSRELFLREKDMRIAA